MKKCLVLVLVLASPLALGRELRVMTYNVGLLRALGRDIVPAVESRARKLPAAIARLAEARQLDVIALQEVWEAGHAQAIGAALKAAGYQVYRPPHEDTFFGKGTGLLLAVHAGRFPKVDWGFVEFRKKAAFEVATRKGIATAVLQGAEPIVVLTAHMQVFTVDPATGRPTREAEGDAHASQAKQISQLAKQLSRGGVYPAILAADLNCGPGIAEDYFRAFENWYGFRDLPTGITWDRANPLVAKGQYPNDPSAAIDHVMLLQSDQARGEADVVFDNADLPLSDHYGVAAEVRWNE